ncbi:MAG TPA: DUF1499 domain-containing protein [Hyphomicrobium sp.]|nr:DUF1499 domain-containing protein [Hyphomicrobium sp.]
MQRFDTMTRTIYAPDQPPSFLARWASRLALFFASVLPIALFLHRLFGLSTPVALNIATACFAGAILVLVMAAIAGLDIWVTGRQGAARIVVATALALGLLAVPLAVYVVGRNWPELNDVTTDFTTPPAFVAADRTRALGSNPLVYPARFSSMQQANYPDIKTLNVARTPEETFELVLQALAKLKLKAEIEAPPNAEEGTPGLIEFPDRTMILGLTDDVVIRVAGNDNGSRVDVRSASRYGSSDFGRNAQRIRELLIAISGRVDASVPNTDAALRARLQKEEMDSAAKRPRAGNPTSNRKKLKRDPSRSSVRREPARKASPLE